MRGKQIGNRKTRHLCGKIIKEQRLKVNVQQRLFLLLFFPFYFIVFGIMETFNSVFKYTFSYIRYVYLTFRDLFKIFLYTEMFFSSSFETSFIEGYRMICK